MNAHLLATVIVALTALKVAGLVGSLWLTERARRLLTEPARRATVSDLQEVHSFTLMPQGSIPDAQEWTR
jgi:hypothetical protein